MSYREGVQRIARCARLLELPRGARVTAAQASAWVYGQREPQHYIARADARHATRQALARLSRDGFFRAVADDVWERM